VSTDVSGRAEEVAAAGGATSAVDAATDEILVDESRIDELVAAGEGTISVVGAISLAEVVAAAAGSSVGDGAGVVVGSGISTVDGVVTGVRTSVGAEGGTSSGTGSEVGLGDYNSQSRSSYDSFQLTASAGSRLL
jgi:hypothetical protein